MDASRFIAGRLRYEGKMAIAAIAISFFVMIIAVCISGGFRRELREGIAMVSGDVSVTRQDMDYLSEDSSIMGADSLSALIETVEGVREVIPAVYRPAVVKSGTEIGGVIVKGVPGGGDSLGVTVPARLAAQLQISAGDNLTAYFIGSRVKARKFRVDGFYEDVTGSAERPVIIAGIKDMQRLNGWEEGEVSAMEVVLGDEWRDPDRLRVKTGEIGTRIMLATPPDGTAPVAVPATSKYPVIFSWLSVIDMNVLVVLLLMTVVAGFNMISGLLILLFRNIRTIGILKSMGMTDRHISEVFLRVSSNLVLKGLAAGNAAALLFCLVQGSTHFLKLDPANYFVSFVPVSVAPLSILVADVIAYLAVMLLLLIPCLFVSKVDPAKTVLTR